MVMSWGRVVTDKVENKRRTRHKFFVSIYKSKYKPKYKSKYKSKYECKYKYKSKYILSFRLEDPVELLFEPQVSQFLTTLTQDQVIAIIIIKVIIVVVMITVSIKIILNLRCVISFSSCELFCSHQHCPLPGAP